MSRINFCSMYIEIMFTMMESVVSITLSSFNFMTSYISEETLVCTSLVTSVCSHANEQDRDMIKVPIKRRKVICET